MHTSWFVSLLTVFLAVGVSSICCGTAAQPTTTDKLSVSTTSDTGSNVKNDVDLLQLVFALSATVEQLEARVEKLEEITKDIASDSPPRIFFGVRNEGVKIHSWATNDATTVKHTAGYNHGLAYDSAKHKLYWSSNDTVYRGGRDDAETEMVFKSYKYGVIQGLAHDWITGNLYGVTRNGIVFVCNTTVSELLDCEVLLSGAADLIGITLHPVEGVMYWTYFEGGIIRRAEMDGSGSEIFLSGLGNPRGITIDFDSSRL